MPYLEKWKTFDEKAAREALGREGSFWFFSLASIPVSLLVGGAVGLISDTQGGLFSKGGSMLICAVLFSVIGALFCVLFAAISCFRKEKHRRKAMIAAGLALLVYAPALMG